MINSKENALNPFCPRCHISRTEPRINTNSFRCLGCGKVFQPDQNPFRENSISWYICEELWIGGELADIAVRVVAKLEDDITTTQNCYYRTSMITNELKDKHYRIEKNKDGIWRAFRGVGAREAIIKMRERGRFRNRDRKENE